jgi:hypothetical protein
MVARLKAKQAKKRCRTGNGGVGPEVAMGLHLANMSGPPQEVRDVFGMACGYGGDDIEGMEVPGPSETALQTANSDKSDTETEQ